MFETIIALTSSNIRRINSVKFLKTFSSFNWSSVQIAINCRPRKKHNGPFTLEYSGFTEAPKKMIRCKNLPLESIRIDGKINNSQLAITCIFHNGITQWFEAKIQGDNRKVVDIIQDQLLNIFKIKAK